MARDSRNRSVRVVVCVGALVATVCIVAGCVPWPASQAQSPFDGKRAFEDLRAVVAIGPRDPGSQGIVQARDYIKRQLTAAGLAVREQAFTATTPVGSKAMVNLTGVVEGTKPGVILLGNHYDTKYFPNFTFVGANDGGSTTAWMLEMARTLGPHREGCSVWLCFFDGEEAFKTWSEADSLYGSRAYVAALKSGGELAQIKAMINVDMIGDCYLGVVGDPGAPAWLSGAVWGTASKLGYSEHFLLTPRHVEDDHVPFRKAGVPTLEVIDFSYGKTVNDHNRNWHTPNDTIDKVCADSLQVVGDVIYHALPDIDANAGTSSSAAG